MIKNYCIAFFLAYICVLHGQTTTVAVRLNGIRENILEKFHPNQILEYSVHKGKSKDLQDFGIVLIFSKNIVHYNIDLVSYNIDSTNISNKESIKIIKNLFESFNDLRGECSHLNDFFGDELITPPPNIFLTGRDVGFSRNEWSLLKYDMREGVYHYDTAFKVRLLKFKCMGLFKNLGARRKYSRFRKAISP